jgi:hypothetical protein
MMAVRGTKTFARTVGRWARRTDEKARLAARLTTLDVLDRLILKTPVGDPSNWQSVLAGGRPPPGYVGGRARGNWQTTVGAPATTALGLRDKSAVRAEGEAVVAAWDGEGSAFITNNLPYIERLEEGWSTQAPAGMVAVTVAEFRGAVAEIAAALRRRR